MKNDEIRASESPNKVDRKRVNKILTSIETVADEVKRQSVKSKTTVKSLKQISNELKLLSCARVNKFNQEAEFLSGKNTLKKLSPRYLRNESMEGLLKIIDEKNKTEKNLITEDIMKRESIKKALKARKREFGFKSKNSPRLEPDPVFYIDVIDKKKSKMLEKILYNNKYRTSLKNSIQVKSNPQISNSPQYRYSEKLMPISLSPSIFRNNFANLQDLNLPKTYQETVKKSEYELGCDKTKLSRLLSLRKIFNLVSK